MWDSNEMASRSPVRWPSRKPVRAPRRYCLANHEVEVVVPEEYMAAVFGDLNARRSAIQGTENRAGAT